MLKSLKEIFRAKKLAMWHEQRERRAMRFEMLEKRIMPAATMCVPPLHAVVAPTDHKLFLMNHVRSDAQAQQQAQKQAILEFMRPSSKSSRSTPWLKSVAQTKGQENSFPAYYSTLHRSDLTHGSGSTVSTSTTGPQSSSGTRVVFVDPSVTDYSQLVSNLVQSAEQSRQSATVVNLNGQSGTGSGDQSLAAASAGTDQLVVVILNAQQNGVDQITQTLSYFKNVCAVDILSHGAAGLITVGTTQLSESDLVQYSAEISQWKSSLSSNADIVLYGCDVAGSSAGTGFVQQLAALTGANVAAATQDVGSSAAGGTWSLGYTTGAIASAALLGSSITQDYSYLLADYVASPSSPNATLTGTSGNDRFIFENGWGSDTVTETGSGGTSVLDFSAVTSNLTFTIKSDGSVSVTDSNGDTLSATSNIQELIGGSGSNTFVFQSGASFSGTIIGGSGTNTLDYSSYGAGATVNLATQTATGTKGVSNITNVVLSEGGKSETVSATANLFDVSQLTANLTASVNADGTISVSDGSNTVTSGSGITQIHCNASETNTLDYTAYASAVTLNLAMEDRKSVV